MFENVKQNITDLAFAAVTMAEDTLSTSTGNEKKTAAVEYIVAMLPVPLVFKGVLTFIFSKFIDEAVEKAVEYMNSIKNLEG